MEEDEEIKLLRNHIDWLDQPFVDIDHRDIRIYYKPKGNEGIGFEFIVLYVVCSYGVGEDDDENIWEDLDRTLVTIIAFGEAAFDDVRHVHVGEDGKGYLYRMNMKVMAQIFLELEKLAKTYCNAYDTN